VEFFRVTRTDEKNDGFRKEKIIFDEFIKYWQKVSKSLA